jgi:hypothetical protein
MEKIDYAKLLGFAAVSDQLSDARFDPGQCDAAAS